MEANYAPCPKCGAADARRLRFTWWGGALGPKLLTHVKCQACGTKYNGKTGQSNSTGILIYFVVVGIITFVLALIMIVFFTRILAAG